MKTLLTTIFLLFTIFSFSQFYERIGHTRQQIYTEFCNYKTVEKITQNNSLCVYTNKVEIFYLFDEYEDICTKVFIIPLENKTSLEFLNLYKNKYNEKNYNEFEYLHREDTINLYYLFNSKKELFFAFTKKSV